MLVFVDVGEGNTFPVRSLFNLRNVIVRYCTPGETTEPYCTPGETTKRYCTPGVVIAHPRNRVMLRTWGALRYYIP
jgi:hypothetical protein